jgi:DNA-binding SARP family transcriptional activator
VSSSLAGPGERVPVAAENPVAFGLLGPLLAAGHEGTPILIAPKQRVILAALLLSANATVPVGRLVGMLWDTSPPPTAEAAVRTYVGRLRHTLGAVGKRLVSQQGGYAIVVHSPGEFDIAELERLRAAARQAAEVGSWSRVTMLCQQALSLWRGTALQDIPSAALQQTEAQRLAELRTELVTARIDAELQLGAASELVPELRKLAAENPLREHIQAQLMLAYYRSGRQADALSVYQVVRGTLVAELSIEPGPELRRLQHLILTGDPALDVGRTSGVMPQPALLRDSRFSGAARPRP